MLSFNKNCSLSLSSASSCCTCPAIEVDAPLLGFVLVVDKYFCNPGNVEGMASDFNQSLFSVWLSQWQRCLSWLSEDVVKMSSERKYSEHTL